MQRSLENYNANVQKISDYINREVAGVLADNSKSIERIQRDNESIVRRLDEEGGDIKTLIETFRSSNDMLKRVVESQEVNEAYMFDILDKWAESRRIKIKTPKE